jgi:hypothetical protein
MELDQLIKRLVRWAFILQEMILILSIRLVESIGMQMARVQTHVSIIRILKGFISLGMQIWTQYQDGMHWHTYLFQFGVTMHLNWHEYHGLPWCGYWVKKWRYPGYTWWCAYHYIFVSMWNFDWINIQGTILCCA